MGKSLNGKELGKIFVSAKMEPIRLDLLTDLVKGKPFIENIK